MGVYDKDLKRPSMSLDEACGLSKDPMVITNVAEQSGDWGTLIIIEDNTTFTTLETNVKINGRTTAMAAADWNALGPYFKGDVIYARITKIELAAGKVQLI
jgi:hypothetical protein